MNTAIRTLRTMIIALAMIGMLSGIGAATTMMDYNVDFDGMGTGSVDIFTITPVGSDGQLVDWSNCEALGTQTGHYGNGWMAINRDTRVDAAKDNTTPMFGSILTQSQMNTDGGNWSAGTVSTYVILNDSYVHDPLDDYMELNQTTGLYDGDMRVDGMAKYESIHANTNITGRLFGSGGTDALVAGVATTSDGTGNVSSAISGMLSQGEMFMNVDSRLIDNATNAESSKTGFTINVPDMSHRPRGYTEQSTGAFTGYAAINGAITDSMNTEFTKVDNINTTGYFYALN